MRAALFEEILKYSASQPRDRLGRWTDSGGGGGAWAAALGEEKSSVLAMEPNEQAEYVYDNDGETMDACVAAMQNGETEALVNNYFAIMEANGDPAPTRPTSKQLDNDLRQDVNSGKYKGWTEAREGYIQDMSGQSAEEAAKTMKEFQQWFGGSWSSADTSTIDKYIEQDHVYDGKIYRGMKFDHDGFEAFMKDVSPGAEIGMRRNSSWSSSEDVARGFAAHGSDSVDSIMVTCVKNRTSAPVAHLSGVGEDEVIAHSGAKWTVLHSEVVEWPNGARKAHITVIEKGE